MTNMIFFILFVGFLSVALLALNLLLAPSIPYTQKAGPFECGFSSYRGQNRSEFNISYYVFGLLFLLFDLEILLVYPFGVSSYNNSIFGLFFLIIFLLILTAGFVFEFARGALELKSKQTGYLESPNVKVSESKDFTNLYLITYRRGTLPAGIRSDSTKRVTEELDTNKRSSNEDLWVIGRPPRFRGAVSE